MTALNDQIAALTADITDTRQKLAKNAAELVRVEAIGEPARKVIRDAEALRQQRADILSRLIMSGSGNLTSSELEAVDAAIEASLPEERRAEDLLNAQGKVLESLRQEADELTRHLSEQTHAVLLKQNMAGAIEVETEALPAVLDAVEKLRMAYSRLAGMRAALAINQELIQKRFGGAQVVNGAHRFHGYELEILCPGVDLPKPYLRVVTADAECRAACAEAVRRWGSIGEEAPAGYEGHIWPPLR